MEQGEVLTLQGQSADSMFILCRGEVKLVVSELKELPLLPRRLSVQGETTSTQLSRNIGTDGGGGLGAGISGMGAGGFGGISGGLGGGYEPTLGAHVIATKHSIKGKHSKEDYKQVLNADRVRIVQRFSLIGKEASQRLPCRDKSLEDNVSDIGLGGGLNGNGGFDLKRLKDVAMAVSFASALKLRARASLNASARAQGHKSTEDPTLKPIYGCTATALGPCLVLEVLVFSVAFLFYYYYYNTPYIISLLGLCE